MAKKKPKRSRNPGGIRTTESGAVIASGKRAVSIARILTLKAALKLETLGMKMSRGVSAAQIIRDEFGWKTRDKKKLLAQLEEWIAAHMRPEDESVAAQLMPDLPVKTREDNPLRIVHRSPLGGKVWRDPEHNEYRYAPAGVGPHGHRGDDVNVGFTNDLQDAIASLDATERHMSGERLPNPNSNTAPSRSSVRWEDLWAVAHNVATPMQFINAWKADTNAKLRHAIGEKHWDTLIAEENSMYRPSNFRALKRKAINLLAETHGVELLGIHKRSGQLAYYLNAGDTYATTIIFIGGRMTIGSWGDAIESGTVKEISNDDLLRYRE